MGLIPSVLPVQKWSFRLAACLAAAMYIGIFCLTIPETIADTVVYAGDIRDYMNAGSSAQGSLLWEPGHTLWRPLGFGLWTLLHSLLRSWSGGVTFLELVGILMALGFLSGMALTLLGLSIGRRLGLSMSEAFAAVLGILSTSAVLNYMHAGVSYIPGLAMSFAGIWLLLKAANSSERAALYAGLSGAALALSAMLWLPYFLSIPAALLAGLVFGKVQARVVWIAMATGFVVGVVILLTAASLAGATSLADLKVWLINSGHGVHPNRRIVRFPTGLTRGFLFLGDDARLIKRFVFGDPYEPAHLAEVLRASLWKIAVVFSGGAALLWALWRNLRTRPAAWVVLAGSIPTIAFAILVFETSAPERYLPLFPAIFCGVCVVLTLRSQKRIRVLAGAFLIVLLLVNYRAYGWDLRAVAARASVRAAWVRERVASPSIVFLLSFRDPLSGHFQRSPFAPDNRKGPLPLFHVTESGNGRVEQWRSDAACRVLEAWKVNGEVWLSLRLLAPRPEPDWQWTENDDPRLHWVDVPAFFTPLETGERIGDADGFAVVSHSEKNQVYLENACRR